VAEERTLVFLPLAFAAGLERFVDEDARLRASTPWVVSIAFTTSHLTV
jgi:hypothetical protein